MARAARLTVTACLGVAFAGYLLSASDPSVDSEGHPWWQHAVFYEIYSRSFADSNNDGIGDLNGVTNHLDYLRWLGVDAVWLTPMFPSPQVDFGYDVSDYENVNPEYGTLADIGPADRRGQEAKRARSSGFRHEPYVRPASLVSRVFCIAHQSEAQLVCVAGFGEGQPTAQQLGFDIRRAGVEIRSADQPVVLPPLLSAAAGLELAQSGGGARHV